MQNRLELIVATTVFDKDIDPDQPVYHPAILADDIQGNGDRVRRTLILKTQSYVGEDTAFEVANTVLKHAQAAAAAVALSAGFKPIGSC